MTSLEELLGRLDELHSSPGVVWRLIQVLRDPEFDIHDVEGLLQADPALSARILRLVNSSAYGLSRKVTSVRQAITFLGARSLRLAVLSFGLVDRLTKGTPARVYDDFWRRALTTATVAARLCRRDRSNSNDEPYCAGLLAEIGMLALCQADTKQYTRIYDPRAHGEHLSRIESEVYGFDHATVGETLLRRWSVPEPLPQIAGSHHQPPVDTGPLYQAVHAGVLLADVLWVPQSPLLARAQQWLSDWFQLDTDGLITLALDVKQDILDSAELFCVKLKGQVDIESLRRQATEQFKRISLETALEYDSISAVIEQQYSM